MKTHMTPDQYRKTLKQLELTQMGAAQLLGVDDRTSRRWAADPKVGSACPIPNPAARFLRYLIATNKTGAQALKKLGE